MAPNSPIFVSSVEFEQEPNTTTSRAHWNPDTDFLKEQDGWRRHDQARQMVRYRDRNHFGVTTQHHSRDRLAVPVYETSPRRPRARSDTRERYDLEGLGREFKMVEVRPSPAQLRRDDGREEKARSPREEIERGSTQSRDLEYSSINEGKPGRRIRVPPVVVQTHPPEPNADSRNGRRHGRSPKSPSNLQSAYLDAQSKLADITLACTRYIDVEAADPRDLTFSKISEQVQGLAFELRVWHSISHISSLPRLDVTPASQPVYDATARLLQRLGERAAELHDACTAASPGDLRFKLIREEREDGDDIFTHDVDDDGGEKPPIPDQDTTENPGLTISTSLHSLALQLKSLKRLSRPLQDASPTAKEEVDAVAALVGEVGLYFGSEEAVAGNGVDGRFRGRRALGEARRVREGVR